MAMGPHGRRAALQVTAMIALGVVSVLSLRSALRGRQAAQDAMEGVRRSEAFQQVMAVALRFPHFVLDRKRLPVSLGELDPKGSFIDPWGTPLRYQIVEPQPMWFRVGSAGPDRVFDTPDDVEHRVGGAPPPAPR